MDVARCRRWKQQRNNTLHTRVGRIAVLSGVSTLAATEGCGVLPLIITPGPTASCRSSAGVTQITLPGSHITPCGGDVPWPTGPIFTPVDTIAQVGFVTAYGGG